MFFCDNCERTFDGLMDQDGYIIDGGVSIEGREVIKMFREEEVVICRSCAQEEGLWECYATPIGDDEEESE